MANPDEKRRQIKIAKIKKKQQELYRRDPMRWLEDRLGESRNNFEWTRFPQYIKHKWDGDRNPLAEAWKALANGNWAGVEAATGCHAKGTELLMYDGTFKKVEEIEIGDQLMGDDSTPRNVLSLARGREQMYRITPNKGESFIVNASHILSLKLTGKNHRRHLQDIVNISVRDYLKETKHFRHLYKQYRVSIKFGYRHKLEYEPYFIGAWLGDGTRGETTICNMDQEVGDYLVGYAERLNAQISIRDQKDNKSKLFKIHFGNTGLRENPIKKYLKTLVVDGQKRIPQNYLTATRMNRLAVLAGLIDTDGTESCGGYIFSTIYKGLSDDVSFLCRGLGLSCTVSFFENDYKGYYLLSIYGDCDQIPVKISRKKIGKRRQVKDVLKTGFKIEALKEGDYYGFELDGNHLYCMKDCTVTHNTSKTYWLARVTLWFLDCYRDSLVVTSAPKQDQLKLHLWAELTKIFYKFKKLHVDAEMMKLKLKVDGSPSEDDESDLAESWIAIGFVAGVGAEEKSATKAQGFHRKDMLIICEETPGMPGPVMTAFQNTSTGDNNLILAVGNPDDEMDELHQFCEIPGVKKFRISAFDYPNVVLDEEIFPGAVTRKSIERRNLQYGEDSLLYKSRVRGISPSQGEDSLIKLDWITQCIDSTVDRIDGRYTFNSVGVDVSNSEAGDKAALAFMEDCNLDIIEEFFCRNATHLAYNLVYSDAQLMEKGYDNYHTTKLSKFDIHQECVGIDAVGVGVATVNAFGDMNMPDVKALQGGQWDEAIPVEEYTAKDGTIVTKPMYRFVSLRAQMYWELREDLRRKQINIRIKDQAMVTQIKKQLIIPKWGMSANTIAVEKKEQIKKRMGGKSPNIADAIVYANWVRKGYRKFVGGLPIYGGG